MIPTPTDADLIERLRKQRQLYNGLGTFRDELWNPDGPEAADRLTSLSAQIEELRAGYSELTDLVERLTDAVERETHDIGGESSGAVLRLLGPAYERARTTLGARHGE